MSNDFGPASFHWLQFEKDGRLRHPQAIENFAGAVGDGHASHAIVLSHGWQNDRPVAERLYSKLWSNMRGELEANGVDLSRVVIGGVLWPAKRYDADYDGAEILNAPGDASAGGGDGLTLDDDFGGPGHAGVGDIDDEIFERKLDELDDLFDPGTAQALKTSARSVLERRYTALFETGGAALGIDSRELDGELEELASQFRSAAEDEELAADILAALNSPQVRLSGGADGDLLDITGTFRSIVRGPRNAVVWTLNKLSYFAMKRRAGTIGAALANELSRALPADAIPLHFAGHSFGARLVSAGVQGLAEAGKLQVGSLTLLQGAYSHYGLTEGRGVFGKAANYPRGAVVCTHTHNDRACALAYPIASRLSRDTLLAIGGPDDSYGSMGANGPQKLTHAPIVALSPADPRPEAGRVNTVLADSFIVKTSETDAHNNVTNRQCGRLVARAMLT